MVIHIIQHVPFEGPGLIVPWAEANRREWKICKAWCQEFPSPGFRDTIVLMGGPMSVWDSALHPWLTEEKAWLRKQLRNGRRVVGICLGAQLLAEALGARVFPNEVKEIGWMPVTWSNGAREWLPELPRQTPVLHWHGDTFDLPEHACRLASTDVCRNQAFLKRNTLGLQFHLEAGEIECGRMIENCGEDLCSASATIQARDALLADAVRYQKGTERWLHACFSRFIFSAE